MLFARVSEALSYGVKNGRLQNMVPKLAAEREAMVLMWYGNVAQVIAAAEVLADYLGPAEQKLVPRQWVVDAVLFNAGHRSLMKSIPQLAADMVVKINDSPHAFTVMWDVGKRLEKLVAEPAWADAKRALRDGGWLK